MENEGEHIEHIKEVFAHYGLARYFAQCLEHGIVNALMQLDLFAVRAEEIRRREQPPRTRDECYKIFDTYEAEQFEKTMGNLIKQLHLFAEVPDQIAMTLLTSKKRRDFLAHHFFRERAVDFTTAHGRNAMLAELKKDQQLFEEADNGVSSDVRLCRPTPPPLAP